MATNQNREGNQKIEDGENKRVRRNRPFPAYSLERAMSIANGIEEFNAGRPYSRLSLAESISHSPESSVFRDLITASTNYGLTVGSSKAAQITLTDLGLSIVAPRSERERRQALIRATMNIDLFKRLYEHFDTRRIPPLPNLKSTLIRDYQIDPELAEACATMFVANGKFVGLIRSYSGVDRVSIQDSGYSEDSEQHGNEDEWNDVPVEPKRDESVRRPIENEYAEEDRKLPPMLQHNAPNNRVFITHGKNHEIVEQLKKILN